MVAPTCAKCRQAITSEDVNVANDVAFCRRCNLAHQLSELVQDGELDTGIDLDRPPHGSWYRSSGADAVVGASHRAFGTALVLAAISLFWNGIVSVFLLLAVSATLRHLGVSVPDWFPAPEMNGPESGGHLMSVGMTIFLWIFLIPFLAIGAGMLGSLVSCLAGRTEVRIQQNEGVVSTRVGILSWRRRFDPAAVRRVRIDSRPARNGDGNSVITIEADTGKLTKLGSMLPAERQRFVAAALRKVLTGAPRN